MNQNQRGQYILILEEQLLCLLSCFSYCILLLKLSIILIVPFIFFERRLPSSEYNDDNTENIEIALNIQTFTHTPFSIQGSEFYNKYVRSDIVLRKLLISAIALEIAQNIGIDYHAATEELYYYMRKNDQKTHEGILAFIDGLYKRINRKD